MSLTNDMIILKEIADELATARGKQEIKVPVFVAEKAGDSYYEKRTETTNDVGMILQEYNFENPIELKALLEMMWNRMEKKDMCAFIPVSMVASAKNRPQKEAREVKQSVSPYIYEF